MKKTNRRTFLKTSLAAGCVGPIVRHMADAAGSPNNKLNLGIIGVAARGGENLREVASQNIVALCDVDLNRLGKAKSEFPGAATYQDFRKLLDHKAIDAVVISTPDHMHAFPAVMAMRMGKHVYCEKPLAHSVWETRLMRKTAAENKVVTQMGTQIHAGDNYRRVVEIVRSGILGAIRRVHVWLAGGVPALKRAAQPVSAPAHIDYDLWTGPAPTRPYDESHLHFNWRYWWDFGNGQLGDFGCHFMDLPFWALDLPAPNTVEAKGKKDHSGDNDVPNSLQVDYWFPARQKQPAVHLTWYHGGGKPAGAEKYELGNAVLFVGEKGELVADYGSFKLFPQEVFADVKVERSIPPSVGHHKEWMDAVKSSGATTCNFDYSGGLTEAVLLGNVSFRAGQKKLEWDSQNLKVVNNVGDVEPLLRRPYRKGWVL